MFSQRDLALVVGLVGLIASANLDRAGAVEASGTTIAVVPSAAAAGITGTRVLKFRDRCSAAMWWRLERWERFRSNSAIRPSW